MHTHHVVFFLFCFVFLAASGYAGGGVMPPHDRSAGPHWQPTNVGFMNYYWPYIDVKAWGGGGGGRGGLHETTWVLWSPFLAFYLQHLMICLEHLRSGLVKLLLRGGDLFYFFAEPHPQVIFVKMCHCYQVTL